MTKDESGTLIVRMYTLVYPTKLDYLFDGLMGVSYNKFH